MKKLVLKSDVVDAMSKDRIQNVYGGNIDGFGNLIINTSTRPTIIRPNPTVSNTTTETLYTKGSCPTCMTCPM